MTALFSTLLHDADLALNRDWPALCRELEAAILSLAEDDTAGLDWSDAQGYPGYTSYASLDDLPRRFPVFSTLKQHLDREAKAFSSALHWDMSGRKLRLDSLWVNVLAPGGMHSGHIHPLSVISGTIYVRIPEGASAIRFEDPRLAFMMAAPPVQPDAPEVFQRFVRRTPRPGLLLMWESWLRHEVLLNTAEEDRLSVSFNYALA
jgi:uncharacterized protein (TIGR02466 family)